MIADYIHLNFIFSPHFLVNVRDSHSREGEAVSVEESSEVETEDCKQFPGKTLLHQHREHHLIVMISLW